MQATQKVKSKALDLGFTKVGIAKAEPLDVEAARLREWLTRGYHASMDWMPRNVKKRVDPRAIVPGAKSVICVALNYYTPVRHADKPGTGKISRYAWGDDYHDILTAKLKQLWEWLQQEFPDIKGRYYVDTGPVMDKVWAQRAGIGWIAKHTNVITQEVGSWVFLGEIITTLELVEDQPATDHCGTCTLCIEACPTNAIVEEYVVDSSKCLSYLTIEHKGEIEGGIRHQFENWIYGCDICQDVCPWNHKFPTETDEGRFEPREWNVAPHLEEWVNMTQEEFSSKFKGSPVKRTKLAGLKRNVGIALEHRRDLKETT
ncbi:MAG: tRNA epoxyqueuosine(34) reductase QueG [Bacteroidetes bacterium]|nr:tRNA epoxyqueuosine(34) reductase QueG [Bacteroidota bacterium]MCW5895195.1 tRNA epoxyqueuosine(34) reductase QueG [Bacteroidota bacterium]